jgi:hypothetical protein
VPAVEVGNLSGHFTWISDAATTSISANAEGLIASSVDFLLDLGVVVGDVTAPAQRDGMDTSVLEGESALQLRSCASDGRRCRPMPRSRTIGGYLIC